MANIKLGRWDKGSLSSTEYDVANTLDELITLLGKVKPGESFVLFVGTPGQGCHRYSKLLAGVACPTPVSPTEQAYIAGLRAAELYLTPEQQALVNKTIAEKVEDLTGPMGLLQGIGS